MRKLITIMFYCFSLVVGISLACCGPGNSTTKTELPDTLSLSSQYYNTNVDEHIYQGCEYFSVGTGPRTWGSHKGNCKNHKENSLNQDYDPSLVIYSVREKEGTYTVYYASNADSAKFIGNIEHCMTFGFDANEVILWSNL